MRVSYCAFVLDKELLLFWSEEAAFEPRWTQFISAVRRHSSPFAGRL